MDGEKERRNLLIVSVAIVLYFWLELPEGFILKKVLGADEMQGKIDPFRVWVAVLILLNYQIYRYFTVAFHTGNSTYVGGLAELHRRARAWVLRRLSTELHLKKKRQFWSISMIEWKDSTAAPDGSHWALSYPSPDKVVWDLLEFEEVIQSAEKDWWCGDACFNAVTETSVNVRSHRMDFAVKKLYRPLILFLATAKLAKTLYLAEFLVPALLSVAALCAAAFGAWRAWAN